MMAAKEELYAKVTPRRQRQTRVGTVKHGSTLDVLLSMGFPKTRALKALVSTGGKNVQAACDWLFSHVDDPFLDDPLPREYVLYLRPSGPLLQQLSLFWQQSRLSCGKNKAHNIFPHITLCQFFMCADGKVEALSDALQTSVAKWKGRIPMPLPLELYTSTTFIGLFVEEQVAEVLKSFAADFANEAETKADVHVEHHKKQLHVTLAYHFQGSHLPVLEKLAKNVDVSSGCDWLAVLFSRDIRFANHETLQVMYPYVPQNDDELELVPGDFIFMSPMEQSSASEGWVYGTSLGTGLSGLLPENYVSRADESDTWVVHGSHSILNYTSPSNAGSTLGGLLFDEQHTDSLLDSLVDPPSLGGLCPPMQVTRGAGQSSLSKMRLFVCRHGERMDVVFGKHWVTQCFDAKGRYVRSNLNMPSSLPTRSNGHRDYDKDCPITVFGSSQARLVGEALLESHTTIDFVYCSPSLRCVQTAQHILQGLQQEGKTKIRVEPGLFEWTKWVSGTCLPTWIPPTELAAANLSVDTTYRPHVPVNKLVVSESYDTYISRSFQVTREILSECKNLGTVDSCSHTKYNFSDSHYKCGHCALSAFILQMYDELLSVIHQQLNNGVSGLWFFFYLFHTGNKVLIVAHASSLEACTRQIQGLSPQNSKDFVQVVRKIPYLGFCACEEMGETGVWQLVDPPILPLTHGPNHSFNWREMLMPD
ncbi:ubiquitin-associated and SH3 domain-containing protein B isoform X2 [Syngnathus scovelli]|uniref:ubiquitin-associated and SH3 domain-containing protein B isoform X2 n=1 Tax=Syngnathus scovelli TaxID=161590 RepID=UPI00210FC965|nr:ubiquitin-associated and SH3 domain-containing protein B isoform X2 [Syngnathus scovelli]